VKTILAVALALNAAPLTAEKASDIIELSSTFGSGTCPLLPFGQVVDSVANPDGTRTAGFSIPSGQVLVVTDINFHAFAAAAGTLISFTLTRVTTANNNSIAEVDAAAGADGSATGLVSLRGAVIKSGVILCGGCFDHTTHATISNPAACSTTVHGFLATDS
jgi:hypothetical protein